ncbi:putative nuclease HARBI1 [Cephus cinctus]|uniref:Nuclease HARBI1 n=1 Tax=Cephus cinctus TaxID=211228 RepID=A0AAJ7REM7_CEPCN|nr:putative nuclease HARBI1 [Cephus cinctus]
MLPDRISYREFRNRYRLSKDSVRFVISLVEDRLVSHAGHHNDISPAMQVLVTLRFYAKGCYQTELGDLHGISLPSVSRIVAKVSDAIATLLPRFVVYPARMEALKMEFYNIDHFPGVVGCIDCTHIAIKNLSQE